MATYNRSQVLRMAIETVRRQTWTDWELLVVGDGCTDDTADVVARFADPRIRFWNLDSPVGEQSGPNNAGCAEARGRYVAFLNHDDFWTPSHLARAVAALDREPGVGLVYGVNIAVYPEGRVNVWGASSEPDRIALAGVPASAWVFRRGLVASVGPWRPARELHHVPSQDWLFRAGALGVQTRLLSAVSVISFPSANRPGSYTRSESPEHEQWLARMQGDPAWLETLLAEIVIDRDVSSFRSGNADAVRPFLSRAAINAVKRVLLFCGWHPLAASLWWRHRRRGGFIDHARRVRGLAALPRPE
jgi:glycosyltransferase involved in cell wall biosynthesis